MFIIGSDNVLEVGRVYTDITGPFLEKLIGQRVLVIRVSDAFEWEKCLDGFVKDLRYAQSISFLIPYFYEVKTD